MSAEGIPPRVTKTVDYDGAGCDPGFMDAAAPSCYNNPAPRLRSSAWTGDVVDV